MPDFQPLNDWVADVLSTEPFYERPALQHWHAHELEPDLSRLVEGAGRALLREDRAIQVSFGNSALYSDVGRGLSYWLFEHNLVYPIFRDWAQAFDVLWDERDAEWNRADASWQRPNASSEERRRRHRSEPRGFIDLQVLREAGNRWLFEAKWWNSVRSTGAVREDVAKLQQHRKGDDRGFVLAFWYGSRESSRRDFASDELAAIGAPAIASVAFPSHVCNTWSGKAPKPEWGYFAMTVFEVLR